ncbi:Clr5 domain-containing protein [Streptomyces sp. NPDC002067]
MIPPPHYSPSCPICLKHLDAANRALGDLPALTIALGAFRKHTEAAARILLDRRAEAIAAYRRKIPYRILTHEFHASESRLRSQFKEWGVLNPPAERLKLPEEAATLYNNGSSLFALSQRYNAPSRAVRRSLVEDHGVTIRPSGPFRRTIAST